MNDGAPATSRPGPDQNTVVGTVSRIVYVNEENGWAVIRVRTDAGLSVSVVGTLLGVRQGDRLRLSGRWTRHPKFGEQLEVTGYVPIAPSTREGIRRFLASGRLRGVGPVTAERIVDQFGLQSLEVLEHEPERLLEISGIGHRKADRIVRSWEEHRGIYPVMVFLQSHGVSPALAVKIHKRFGAAAVEAVRENPYVLAEEIHGVGFLTADRIARSLGIEPDAPERLRAGLIHTLGQAVMDGHVYLPRERLFEEAGRLLEVEEALLDGALEALLERATVEIEPGSDGDAVFLPRLHEAEVVTATELIRIMEGSRPFAVDAASAVAAFERSGGLTLAPEQREAVATALEQPITVITGGPGTGKTTIVRGLTSVLTENNRSVLLAAPTGRAAKRLAEATGMPARTVHRLLEYQPADHAFARHRQRPLEGDLLVVDEVSMLDVELAAALLAAVPTNCRLVLVGDADQLPSVGPGHVLGDIIASDRVAVVRLERIFRQQRDSLIVANAHRINQGTMPALASGEELADFYFVERSEPAGAAATLLELVATRIPERFGLDPVEDVQVLTPVHRGELGVTSLNAELQAALNPVGEEVEIGFRKFRRGDKVMQIRNNYDLGVFNGDLGRIHGVDEEEGTLLVNFDGRLVAVPQDNLDELTVAYACTIHKSQGSEYPAVVVALHDQHWVMLQRNLVYTAVTRGRRLVVIVGTRRALARGIRNATQRRRFTRLAERLRRVLA